MDPSPDGAPEPAGSDPRPDEAPRGRGTTDRKGRERTATQSGHRRDERPPARPTSASGDASSTAMLLGKARSWGYQLQKLSLARAADSPFDILVIDPTKDGDDESALKPAEVERLKRKTDGSRRIVLAYLSIGEAESYRSYWRKDWKRNPPDWLLRENPEWEENYAVCFWNEGWQDILCGSRGACLDRILAQGFDGIYLDKCDVTEDLKQHEKAAARTRKDLDGDMVALVQRLATYARERLPGFLVVMQNAEPLLERPELRRIIDASAKEELLFGLDKPEKPNDRDEIDWSRERLDLMRRDGKPVLLVEYLEDRAKITKAAEEARRLGYVLYVSTRNRELDKLVYTTLEA
jgi:cysteinyl-tRNA synthetase